MLFTLVFSEPDRRTGNRVTGFTETCTVRIYDQIEEMKEFIAEGDWDGLEKAAKKRCEKLAGKDKAKKVADVDLTDYVEELEEGLKRAYEEGEELGAMAVYFEYDMENQWNGAYFLCTEYTPEDEEDDDWATACEEEIEGPAAPELAELYASTFDTNDEDRGVNGYLIARTIASFGRCVDILPDPECAVCIGFHDQEGVLRIREGDELEYDVDDDDEDEDEDE